MEDYNINVPEAKNELTKATPAKATRWIGLVAIVVFFVLGGWSYCPWYIWIFFILLALLTLGGTMKWSQMILGVCIILWGTPILAGGSDGNSSLDSYESHKSVVSQSESERRYIERQIRQIEELKRQFDRAVKLGLSFHEQKRISDQAWNMYHELEQKNLTPEQSDRLSRMFAL